MSAVLLAQVADAVTSELNSDGRSWSQLFVAKRMNAPKIKLSELANLHVFVTPLSRTRSPLTRTKSEYRIEVMIGIQKGIATPEDAEDVQTDTLIKLGEEIDEYFAPGLKLTDLPTVSCIGSQYGAGDDSSWMSLKAENELQLFTGIVKLTFLTVV